MVPKVDPGPPAKRMAGKSDSCGNPDLITIIHVLHIRYMYRHRMDINDRYTKSLTCDHGLFIPSLGAAGLLCVVESSISYLTFYDRGLKRISVLRPSAEG